MTQPQTARWSADQLAYCSNVHPGESLAEVMDVIGGHVRAVRRRRGLEVMSSGLWLSEEAATELTQVRGAITRFRERLNLAGIRLTTLNGFPFGGFHDDSVKAAVYEPDWTCERRAEYTARLARALAAAMPADQTIGTISTLPLGAAGALGDDGPSVAARVLCRFARWLAELEEQTKKTIVVCLEMEPGCVLEDTEGCVRYFQTTLPAAAAATGVSAELVARHIGICYDVCHQAVMFEDSVESLSALHDAGVTIGKIQLSNAVEVPYPDRPSCLNAIATFDEPRYLHQVRTRSAGELLGRQDLPDALDADNGLPTDSPWRVHFHVPLQVRALAAERLTTTRPAIFGVLDFLADHPELSPHLEVETYTWHVLPKALRPHSNRGLHRGLAGELAWVESHMKSRGLLMATDS